MSTFSENLKHEREARGFAQKNIAEKLGTSHITVSRWERGESTPQPYFRRLLSELFQVPISKLFPDLSLETEELGGETEQFNEGLQPIVKSAQEERPEVNGLSQDAIIILGIVQTLKQSSPSGTEEKWDEISIGQPDEKMDKESLMRVALDQINLRDRQLQLRAREQEAERKELEHTIDMVNTLIDNLEPDADDKRKAALRRELLPVLFHSQEIGDPEKIIQLQPEQRKKRLKKAKAE